MYKIKILSPVSVFSGDQSTPFDYYYDSTSYSIVYFDSIKLISDMYADGKISDDILNSQSMQKIRRIIFDFLSIKENLEKYKLYNIVVVGDKFSNDFKKSLENIESEKQLIIDKLIHNQIKNKAVLPGSSIKGCFRTAIISRISSVENNAKEDFCDHKGKYSEKILVGGVTEDPFKNLLISDSDISFNSVGVFQPIEFCKDNKEYRSKSPKNFAEAIIPKIWFKDSEDTELGISIDLIEKIKFKNGVSINNTEDVLKGYVHPFYYEIFIKEYDRYYKGKNLKFIEDLKSDVEKFSVDGWSLFRLGHYSHEESNMLQKIGQGRSKRTFRVLAEGRVPFGWAMIKERK